MEGVSPGMTLHGLHLLGTALDVVFLQFRLLSQA